MSEEKRCQAVTSDGSQCKNEATYPEDNPVACHIPAHRRQLLEKGEINMPENKEAAVATGNEEIEEVKTPEAKTHVFASTALTHTVFVRYPKDDERDYFRAEFTGGRYETDNEEKAKLLEELMKKNKALKKKVTKVQ